LYQPLISDGCGPDVGNVAGLLGLQVHDVALGPAIRGPVSGNLQVKPGGGIRFDSGTSRLDAADVVASNNARLQEIS